jgi:hydrogenase maturation protein HypF
MTTLTAQTLPRAAPARVLACGAFLKNTACLLDGDRVAWSAAHDDLSTPAACAALELSLQTLLQQVGGRVDAVAHDLHPDFHSTRVAQSLAARLGVPALAVQHHHAHIGVVQAEQGLGDEPLVGLALDGVGLGSDGLAWGGEVLAVQGAAWQRVAHLPLLALPGGDVAAREPWRMAAAVLHAAGRGDTIVPRMAPQVGDTLAKGIHGMLSRDLNCPRTSSAGRWFDAAAGLLGLCLRQREEAEAAIALERCATAWLEQSGRVSLPPPTLDLLPLVAGLADESDAGRGAARFHLALAQGLVQAALQAARDNGARVVALGGGCFFNRLLSREVTAGLQAAGLAVLRPQQASCGDAGLALGQAWVAAHTMALQAQATPACTTED